MKMLMKKKLLENFLSAFVVFVFFVIFQCDWRAVDDDAERASARCDLDGVASDVSLHGQRKAAGDLLGEDSIRRSGAAVAGNQCPTVAEADGVGHVVVGANVGTVGDTWACK